MLKIGIMGLGTVGNALAKWFDNNLFTCAYDKYKPAKNSIEQINECEIIFICVPTPDSINGCDITEVEDAVSKLDGEKIVVIKSTVIVGTTEILQAKYPQHKFIFNPEFLSEKEPYARFTNPDVQIIGYTKQSANTEVLNKVFNILPKAKKDVLITATEAEMVKYMENSFLGLKIIFGNQFYDLCEKLDIDYEACIYALGFDSRIGHSHFNINQDGYRGYGEKCLPKDINAIIKFADENSVDMKLMKTVEEINKGLIK
jgi:UDPglucose 6-dehydrogenase